MPLEGILTNTPLNDSLFELPLSSNRRGESTRVFKVNPNVLPKKGNNYYRPYNNVKRKPLGTRQNENFQHRNKNEEDVIIIETNIPSSHPIQKSNSTPQVNFNNASRKLNKKDLKESYASPSITVHSGFDNGYEAEAILGAKDCEQGIFYLVKWKDRDEMELIPALITLSHVPSLVILFYAQRIKWIADSLSSPDPG